MDAVNSVSAAVPNISTANASLGAVKAEQIFGTYLANLSNEIQGTEAVPLLSPPLSATDFRVLLQQLVSDQLISDIESREAATPAATATSSNAAPAGTFVSNIA